MNRNGKNYDEMTLEELQREFREAFFETDIIDDNLNDELEKMQEALNRKRPVECLFTPEESWEHYLEDKAEDLEPFLHPMEDDEPLPEDDWFDPEKSWQRFMESHGEELAEILGTQLTNQEKPEARTQHVRSVPSLLRKVLIAAVIVVLLAGAALAADYAGLWAWVPRWNAVAGRYEPAAQEVSGESPIPAALTKLGITEPLYPAKLPEGFVITETHISEEPLILFEQYACGEQHISITITPIKGFKNILYQKQGEPVREYQAGTAVHYILSSERNIAAVWYTASYATTISGDVSLEELKKIIDSIYEASE